MVTRISSSSLAVPSARSQNGRLSRLSCRSLIEHRETGLMTAILHVTTIPAPDDESVLPRVPDAVSGDDQILSWCACLNDDRAHLAETDQTRR